MDKRNCVPLIPVQDPPDSLTGLAAELKANGFDTVIIVDDGSRKEFQRIFLELRERYGCDVVVNARSMGQGRALKNGMNHYLNTYSHAYKGVITLDCSGQYPVKDAVRLDEEIGQDDRSLLLGSRDLSRNSGAFRSRSGDLAIHRMLKFFIGGSIADTQTCLRGIPDRLVYEYLTVAGERFEYYTAMLIESIKKGIPVREIPVGTVPDDKNGTVHLRAARDPGPVYVLILSSFLKFSLSSLSAFVIDYGIFCLVSAVLAGTADTTRIWTATVAARIVSSLYSFTVNRHVVFKSRTNTKKTFAKFFTLIAAIMCSSALLVLLLTRVIGWRAEIVKPIVDTSLFVVSYQFQRRWVFKTEHRETGS